MSTYMKFGLVFKTTFICSINQNMFSLSRYCKTYHQILRYTNNGNNSKSVLKSHNSIEEKKIQNTNQKLMETHKL